MTFTVIGLNAAGAVLIDCDTVVTALEEAVNLPRSGYVDVLIDDGAGLEYTPTEFSRAFG